MNKDRFDELSQAIRHAGSVRKGEAVPHRVWKVARSKDGKISRQQIDPEEYREKQRAAWESNVTATRAKLNLSQSKFVALLGISVKTLHNWEQGRRKPTGAARILLRVAALHPKAVLEAAA